MDDEQPRKDYPLAASKMSKTPSWIMLGFVLGALFVLAFPARKPAAPAAPAPVPAEPARPAVPRDPPPLSRIEFIFEREGQGAVWSGDTTEVVLWSVEEERYSDFYEVKKIDGKFYFRSIPALTRRIITPPKPRPDALLQFTESEEQYREWQERARSERPIERMWRPKAGKLPGTSVTPPALPTMPAPKLDVAPPPINPTLPVPEKKNATRPPAR